MHADAIDTVSMMRHGLAVVIVGFSERRHVVDSVDVITSPRLIFLYFANNDNSWLFCTLPAVVYIQFQPRISMEVGSGEPSVPKSIT